MLRNIFSAAAFVLAGILLYRFHKPILAAFERFDARNRERIRDEQRDRQDPHAHFRHALALAEEQVEMVTEVERLDERTAQAVKRYLFEGEIYATREDATSVRTASVRAKAAAFYRELPYALRKSGTAKVIPFPKARN